VCVFLFVCVSCYREAFKSEYNKAYATQGEEETRYGNFLAFLQSVDERNAAEKGSASHGITKVRGLRRSGWAEQDARVPGHGREFHFEYCLVPTHHTTPPHTSSRTFRRPSSSSGT
jgi:hypothetical protein